MLSSSNTELPEVEPRDEGRRPGLGPATTGADLGTGIKTCHDIPSRSANSVFTLANDRRKSAHCAWIKKGKGVVARLSVIITALRQ